MKKILLIFILVGIILFVISLPLILSTAWDVSTAVYLQEFSVAGKETSPRGVFFKPDGLKMYTIGFNGKSVDEYDLDSAWNVSTAIYVHEFYVGGKDTVPTGVFFKPDGTKMYTIGSFGDSVDEYDLGIAWNVTSAVYLHEFHVGGEETSPEGVFFKPDGTKMYTIGYAGRAVDEYDLGTAWNVTAAVYLQTFSVLAKESAPRGVFFKPDGTKMYTIGSIGRAVDEYDLGTAWNVTTAVYLQEFSVLATEAIPEGVFFKPDGTKMYIMGDNGNAVDEYNLPAVADETSPNFCLLDYHFILKNKHFIIKG